MVKFSRLLRKPFSAAGKIDPRVGLLLLLVSAVVIGGAAVNTAAQPSPRPILSNTQIQPTQTISPGSTENPESSATPFPPEYQTNQQQTIGLTLAAAALVLIVVVGVMGAFIQNQGDV